MTTQGTGYREFNIPQARQTQTDGRSATDTVEPAVPALKVKLGRMVETGKTRATEWKGGLQDGIREKPVQSVLIAAAVGVVIGLVVGRSSR